jgi:ATP-dependent Clp protease ATP-binding subunit ClpC
MLPSSCRLTASRQQSLCCFIRELCERRARTPRDRPLTAEDSVSHFICRTGLPGWLLRDEEPLDRAQLLAALRSRVIGQQEGVKAAARVVTTFKAGLNSRSR